MAYTAGYFAIGILLFLAVFFIAVKLDLEAHPENYAYSKNYWVTYLETQKGDDPILGIGLIMVIMWPVVIITAVVLLILYLIFIVIIGHMVTKLMK